MTSMDDITEDVLGEHNSWESDITPSNQDSCSTITDDNHSDDGLNLFLDFDDIVEKDIVISSYMLPETLHLFKVTPTDSVESLIHFVRNTLYYDHHYQKLAILFGNSVFPVDIEDVVTLKPGVSLIILPKHLSRITIVIENVRGENSCFDLEIDVIFHVSTLKQMIEAEYGFPVNQQELLFNGVCLENQRRLYQCRIGNQSMVQLQLIMHYNMVVRVRTFWKVDYDIFVDPCMTVDEVLDIVLRRCITSDVYKGGKLMKFDFLVPRHVLIMIGKGGRTLKSERTLGAYNIGDRDQLLITTIGRHHKINLSPIEVSLMDGRAAGIVISSFDTWAILALHLHGITGHMLDQIRIYANNKLLDLGASAGSLGTNLSQCYFEMRTQQTVRRKVSSHQQVHIYLGSNVTETIQCCPEQTIGDVKVELRERGVPNIQYYTILNEHSTLPHQVKLNTLLTGKASNICLSLKLESFPLSYQYDGEQQDKFYIKTNQTIQSVLRKIEQRSVVSQDTYKVLLAGSRLHPVPNTPIYDSQLAIGTNLHLLPKNNHIFLVHCDTHVTKLEIADDLSMPELKKVLWDAANLPSSSLSSQETFLTWYLSLGSPQSTTATTARRRVLRKETFSPNIHTPITSEQEQESYTRADSLPFSLPNLHVINDIKLSDKRAQTEGGIVCRPAAAKSHRKFGCVQNPMGQGTDFASVLHTYADGYSKRSEEAINKLSTLNERLPIVSKRPCLTSTTNTDLCQTKLLQDDQIAWSYVN